MTLFEAQRAVAEIVREIEAKPDDRTAPLLLLTDFGKRVKRVELGAEYPIPMTGETWRDLTGRKWTCEAAFLVHDREVRFMRLVPGQTKRAKRKVAPKGTEVA